jgi:hypothetical protein
MSARRCARGCGGNALSAIKLEWIDAQDCLARLRGQLDVQCYLHGWLISLLSRSSMDLFCLDRLQRS